MWGESPTAYTDISNTFCQFINGEISKLPWSQDAEKVPRTDLTDLLLEMNQNMCFTISSQPAVNGAPSSDPHVGWGPNEFGYVYQKAYIEFFAPPEFLNFFINEFKKLPTVSYSAINLNNEVITNLEETHTVAMTWGVFPNFEVMQPTIADLNVFKVWKEEAFYIWKTEWGELY
jgi:methylenetetrahydrofolate reductase (NADPH)